MKPELFHAHHASYFEDLPYWISLADESDGPILELGCGTGRILQHLDQEGFHVFGLDHEFGMLQYLKQLLPSARVFVADLTAFHLGMEFSLIFLPCNTYSTLSSVKRQAGLRCIDHHLKPGGCFAASLPNPADLAEMGDSDEAGLEETFFHPETGYPVQVTSSWRTLQDQVTIDWHYDHLFPDGQVIRNTHSTSHYMDPAESYIQEMKAQGWTVYADGEFDGGPFQQETDTLILRGYKSEG